MKVELNYQNVMDKDKKLKIHIDFSPKTETGDALTVIKEIKSGIAEIVGGSMGGRIWDERDV